MHNLHESMDARVSATRAQRRNRCLRELAQGGFKFVLHRTTGGLALPPFVGLAVIAQAHRQAHGLASFSQPLEGAGLGLASGFVRYFFHQRFAGVQLTQVPQFIG